MRLRTGHYDLRVRDLGARRIATLKGVARSADGPYECDEWEVDIGDDDRHETWPASEVRERGRTASFHELESELRDGRERADLDM